MGPRLRKDDGVSRSLPFGESLSYFPLGRRAAA